MLPLHLRHVAASLAHLSLLPLGFHPGSRQQEAASPHIRISRQLPASVLQQHLSRSLAWASQGHYLLALKRHQHSHCPGLQENKQHYPAHAKVISHLSAVLEELPDVPLYVNLHDMCKTIKATAPKAETFRSAIINAGGLFTTLQSCVARAQEL